MAPLTDKHRNATKTIHQSRSGQPGSLISSGHLHCLRLLRAAMCLDIPILKTKPKQKLIAKC